MDSRFILEKRALLEAIKIIDRSGLEVASSGNISTRLSDGSVLISPSATEYGELDVDSICHVNPSGIVLSGSQPSSDLQSHLGIYRKREDIFCIVHTHALYATVMGFIVDKIEVLGTVHADYFGREIKCHNYMNHRIHGFDELVNHDEDVYLMKRHGALVLADSCVRAARRSVALEYVCKLEYKLHVASIKSNPMPQNDVHMMHQFYMHRYGK